MPTATVNKKGPSQGAIALGLGGVAVLVAGGIVYATTRKNTATLNGTVISAADGSVVVGASVAVGKQSATTDAKGQVAMKGLPTGKNSLTITATGFDTYTATINLVAGSNTMTWPIGKTGANLAALTGKVTSIDTGTPILGAKVAISGKSATTGADGSYSITGLPTGSATGTCSLSGYNTVTKNITLAVGPNTLNFQITNRGTVSGTVSDSVTGAPISGAVIAGPSGSGLSATSNSQGLYSIIIPSSVTSLGCAATGYTTQSQSVTVNPGATIPLNFSMVKVFTQTGTIQGTVQNANDSTPIPNATIVFQPGSYSVKSGSNGSYSIDLPTGSVATNYSITASATGFNQWTGSVLLNTGAISTKDINMTPTATPNGGIIGGVNNAVTLASIGGAQINLLTTTGAQTGISTTTAADGSFSLSNVPPGTYQCWASASGFAQAEQAVTVVSGQTTVMLAFYLQPAATAIGFTMDVMIDPSTFPTAYYWYADINGEIFNWFARITDLWKELNIDMSGTDFATEQTLTVQLYDSNYNPIYNSSGTLAIAVVPLGGPAGPLVKNDHAYSFNFAQQVLYDDGLLST